MIDPATGKEVARLGLGVTPSGLAVGGGLGLGDGQKLADACYGSTRP